MAENTNLLTEKRIINSRIKKLINLFILLCVLFASSCAALGIMIYRAEQKTTRLEAAITELKRENEAFKATTEDITKKHNELYAEKTQLETEITRLQEENEALSTETDELDAKIADLERRLSENSGKTGNSGNSGNSGENVKYAYLTFDDGVSKYTNKILDILKEYNVKATFFVNWHSGCDELYERIINEGHAIGNHTYDHKYGTVYASVSSFKDEVTKLQNKIENLTGYKTTLFRFPGGSNNTVYKKYNSDVMPGVLTAIHDLGYEYYDWNVDSGDASTSAGLSADEIVSNVLNGATQKKAIILMHDTATKKTTVDALPRIIEGLINKGYTLLPLSSAVIPTQFRIDPKA